MEKTDKHILFLARTDSRRAFHLAFDQYWETLYRHACRKVDSADVAKDLVQDVFVTCWDQFEKLAAQEQLQPYLFAVLRNKIFKLYERDEVRLRYAMQHQRTQADVLSSENPQELLLSKELATIVAAEIEALPERMRLIYQLRHEEGLGIREIADRLALSEQTVKNQLHTASVRLRKRITYYGWMLIMSGSALYLQQAV